MPGVVAVVRVSRMVSPVLEDSCRIRALRVMRDALPKDWTGSSPTRMLMVAGWPAATEEGLLACSMQPVKVSPKAMTARGARAVILLSLDMAFSLAVSKVCAFNMFKGYRPRGPASIKNAARLDHQRTDITNDFKKYGINNQKRN